MMRRTLFITILFTLLILPRDPLTAGDGAGLKGGADDASLSEDITVSWSIGISSKKGGDMGIAETYNGGVETLFAGNGRARIRLVSLMRIQSIFLSEGGMGKGSADGERGRRIMIVKESGKEKHVTTLTGEEWKVYNKKYDGAVCALTEDTASVLRHRCKKAVITLKDGKVITAWYTTSLQAPALSVLEPAFSGVPGLVLKYEYTYKRKTITYTATSISHAPIAREVFDITVHTAPLPS